MMNMNPKAVAQDAGTLLALIDAMGDAAKARELLQGIKDQADAATEALDKMIEERKKLETRAAEVKAAASALEQRTRVMESRERELDSRDAALKQKEADHALRLKRLREAVA